MRDRDLLARTFASLQTPDPAAPARRLRLDAAQITILMLIAVWLAVIAGAGWSLEHSRQAALRAARNDAANLAALLAQDVRARLDAWDMLLIELTERLETDGVAAPAAARLTRNLTERVRQSQGLHLACITDAAGRVIASSNPDRIGELNLSDRDYFAYHASHPQGGRFLGVPIQSRYDGRWVVALSRRWNLPDGSFGGVVMTSTDLGDMDAGYRPLHVGAHGTMSLYMPPGIAVARMPPAPDRIGRFNAADGRQVMHAMATDSGVGRYTPTLDGVERVYAHKRVDGYDLVQFVGLAMDDILADWWRELQDTVAVALGVLLLTGLLALHLLRLMRHRRNERLAYRLLADNATDMILCMDTQMIRRYVSPACPDILGYEPAELVGKSPLDVSHPDDLEHMRTAFEAVLAGTDRRSTNNRIRHKNGHFVWVDTQLKRILSPRGQTIGIIGALRDATARKVAEIALENANRHLAALAKSDGLTGLANRRHFDEVLDQELRRAQRVGAPLALIMLDVDRFKLFNDRYGHPAGDSCLRMIADAVVESLQRPADLAARYGGEELAVVLPDTDAEGAYQVAERIADALRSAAITHADGVGGVVTVSIGIAIYRPDAAPDIPEPTAHDQVGGEGAATLIGTADRALYAAKSAGRARIEMARQAACIEPATG
jgi:diguanylate cyclase (GGDEF)-like protein/PAS domain S-box-containing protein